jgi:hypothetical protein
MERSNEYNSYMAYKQLKEDNELRGLIYNKYLKVLGRFIENMYPKLKFDIFVCERNKKQRKSDWYGMVYMNLVIYDVIRQPIYNPRTFDPSYRSLNYDGFISSYDFYDTIDSYMSEINKHLLISFEPPRDENMSTTMMMSKKKKSMLQIPDFECWAEHWKKSYVKGDFQIY